MTIGTSLGLAAPAKVNLSLRVLGRRADGMHLLKGVMVLVDLCDQVSLTLRRDGRLVRAWRHEAVADEDDIVMKAVRRVREVTGCGLGVEVAVEKRIPVGGGLGGASSNAAAALSGLDRLWGLRLGREKLLETARFLGADVPFFLHGTPCAVSGIGDVCEKIKVAINNYLLVFPPIAAMTAAVYAEYDRLTKAENIATIPFWLDKSDNDLTMAAVATHPDIAAAARCLYEVCGEARLTGSGSTVFAEFVEAAAARRAQARLPAYVKSVVAKGLSRHPVQYVGE